MPVENLELGPELAHHARRARKLRIGLLRSDTVGFDLTGGDERRELLRRAEGQIDVVAEEVLHHRRAAAIRNLHRLHLCLLGEERGREMPRTARTRMRHRSRIGFHVPNELGEGVGRQRLAADEHQRIAIDEGDRYQVPFGVVGKRRVKRNVRRDLQVMKKQRMPVGRRARDAAGADGRAAAARILDDKASAEPVGETRRDQARELVGRAAGRIGHDDGDVLRRVILAEAGKGQGEEQRGKHESHVHLPGMIGSST